MHHAPAHGDPELHDAFEHARKRQSADAARGQCHVDGSSAIDCRHARIRSPLVDRYGKAALRQQNREQTSRQPAANDVDAVRSPQAQAISLSAAASSSTRSKMSMNRLYSGAGAMRMMSGSRQSQTMP